MKKADLKCSREFTSCKSRSESQMGGKKKKKKNHNAWDQKVERILEKLQKQVLPFEKYSIKMFFQLLLSLGSSVNYVLRLKYSLEHM